MNIAIHGAQTGVYGSRISGGSNDFIVRADDVDIKNLAFVGNKSNTAITLGVPEFAIFDTHINNCWFAGVGVGIRLVNAGGLDLSHNTFDSGTSYGIYSNQSEGDVMANYVIADDLRGFQQISTVSITGPSPGTANYQGYTFSGIFDNSVQSSASISLTRIIGAKISGIFTQNHYQDISISGSSAVVISNFHVYNPGQTSIFINQSNGVNTSNGVIFNSGTLEGGTPSISVVGSANTTVAGITSVNGGSAHASYGLSIDSASGASRIYGNNFNAQTVDTYNVQDPTALFEIKGALSATSVVAGNGYSGTATVGGCSIKIVSGIVVSTFGCN
ncbi:hypothetical protein [Terriglobus saanensis]|nr:hypothetical protein [Terriglobus saanensis]